VPEVAVTVIEYVPEGVPLTCGGVFAPLLHEGCSRTSEKSTETISR
jgi:hypothetical protein